MADWRDGETPTTDWRSGETPVAPSVAPAAPTDLKYGTGGDAAMGGVSGLTLGLAPRIGAVGDTVRGWLQNYAPGAYKQGYLGDAVSSDYDTNLRVQKLMYKQAHDESPIAYDTGQVAGSLVPAVVGAGAGGEAANIAASGAKRLLTGNAELGYGLGKSSQIAGQAASNMGQAATSAATNAEPGQGTTAAWEAAKRAGLWTMGGAAVQKIAQVLGPNPGLKAVAEAATDPRSTVREEAQNVLQKFYPNAANANEAVAAAKSDLTGKVWPAITATAGAAANGAAAYKQNPNDWANIAVKTGEGALGGGFAGKFVAPIAGAVPAIARNGETVGAIGSGVANTQAPGDASKASGLDDLITRFKNWAF